MHVRLRSLRVVAVVLLAAGATGCVAVAVGAAAGYGAYKYATNDETRAFAKPLPEVWVAALDSLREQGHPVAPAAAPDPNRASVTIDDVTLTATASSPDVTHVTVRIGTFDTAAHRARARRILDAISRRLGYAPPS